MIIDKPCISRDENDIIVSAPITVSNSSSIPDSLWYRLPAAAEPYLADSADAFISSLVVFAMSIGEDVEIRGTVSPRLIKGLDEFQNVYQYWFPKKYRKVRIIAENQAEVIQGNKAASASSYTGGVDSTYTLLNKTPPRTTDINNTIRYSFFVFGFDIPLNQPETYWAGFRHYEQQLKANHGVTLFPVATNLRSFPGNWEHYYGSAVVGTALLFQKIFSTFYIPSGRTYPTAVRWGSSPVTDPLLSTAATQVIHDGANIERVDKGLALAHEPETYDSLRVCWEKPEGLTNCCNCRKCLRMMITLELAGTLNKYSTFPKPLRRDQIRSMKFTNDTDRIFGQAILNKARELGRSDIASDLEWAMRKSRNDQRWQQAEKLVKRTVRKVKQEFRNR